MQLLDVGEPIPIHTNWWDDDGQPVEPTTITLTITKPNGATVIKTKADMTQGATTDVWDCTTVADVAGAWRIHAVGTVAGDTIVQDSGVLVGVTEDRGPCDPWCTWDDVEACGTLRSAATEPQKQLWLEQATEILYQLTDRHYPGVCTVTRSLCFACAHCYPVLGGMSDPYLGIGLGVSLSAGLGLGLACGCEPYPGIDLGGKYPVLGVYEVVIDGQVLDPSAWILRGRRWLVRTDNRPWPTGWNTADPDAWRVTWAPGRMPPRSGQAAAALLALHIGKRCQGDPSCQLPQRVASINREGVTFNIVDPMTMLADGLTGVDLVDQWLAADRRGRRPRPTAYAPGLHGNRRI